MLLAEAAEAAARRNRLPSPRNIEIDHFVVLCMENRSFDHYFGWLSGEADAIQKQTYPNPAGQHVETRHFKTLGSGGAEYKGCGHPDPGHGWDSGRAQLNGGFLAEGSGNDEYALTYFNQGELPFIHPAAKAYTLYDRYFCSILASTYPNRHYKWAAQCGGTKSNEIPAGDTRHSSGRRSSTARSRRGSPPATTTRTCPSPRSTARGRAAWTNPITRFYADCAAGTLPNIAFVDPPFKDGGGGDGLSADEHPLGDVRLGQAFMADVVNAFIRSPNYRKRRAVHRLRRVGRLLRPRAPAARDRRPRRTATRTRTSPRWASASPTVAISPWTRATAAAASAVDHGVYGHESILKLISLPLRPRLPQQAPPLRAQHRPQLRLGAQAGLRAGRPARPARGRHEPLRRRAAATSPPPTRSRRTRTTSPRLEEVAYRFGVPVFEAKPHQLFRQPDSVVKAIRRERAEQAARKRRRAARTRR